MPLRNRVDPWGRIVEGQRLEPGVMGVIDAPLPRPTGVTPYGRFGDFLFFFSMLTAFILSLWPSIRRSRVQGSRVAI